MNVTVVATVVGGGLAGSEAAWALAERGVHVTLYEMRPAVRTPAHHTDRLAELVCSNSFKSIDLANAHGLLKAELRALGSLLLPCADAARVPGGTALAVDREVFSQAVHERVDGASQHHRAARRSGRAAVARRRGDRSAHVAPPHRGDRRPARLGGARVLRRDRAGGVVRLARPRAALRALPLRQGRGRRLPQRADGRAGVRAFLDALLEADQHQGHDFDQVPYFEGCLPVEEMARRGRETLRFGPMKPVGLPDPRTGREPHAVVQLRREDRAGQMWNLVGFQTRLRIPEQQRVFRLIPGLEQAEYLRFGSIHRNSYLNSPASLGPALTARDDDRLFFAGQLTGVEGYTESLGTGLLAGINLARRLGGQAAGRAAAHHDARRAVPLPARGGSRSTSSR